MMGSMELSNSETIDCVDNCFKCLGRDGNASRSDTSRSRLSIAGGAETRLRTAVRDDADITFPKQNFRLRYLRYLGLAI